LSFEDLNLYEPRKPAASALDTEPLRTTAAAMAPITVPFADTGLAVPNNFSNNGAVQLHERGR
jgi:hypothetical protein